MRQINIQQIRETIAELCIQANTILRPDVLDALKSAYKKETKARAKTILAAIIENARIAGTTGLAICQDTGLPIVFADIGQDAHIVGGSLNKAINDGVNRGYKQGYLRSSVIRDPILRGKPAFSPIVIHTEAVVGGHLRLTVLPKGFGSENKSRVKMFKPTTDICEIKDFVVDAVKQAGPDACPPFVVGVGIGGTQDYACLLAKKALLRKIRNPKSEIRNKSKIQNSKLEKELLEEINRLNIGPMGLGGKTTALAVNIEIFPTHIAGLPVAVNISCHAMRSASSVI